MTQAGASELARFEVGASLAGERLDRALALALGLSRAGAARLVAEGKVQVGGSVVRAGGRRLRPQEVVEVAMTAHGGLGPGEGAPERAPGGGETGQLGGGGGEPKVVFVDQHLVVVDKPAGLVVHPGAGNRAGTLVQKLVARFPDIEGAGPDRERPGIVHRLDKGTSGLIVVARTEQARKDLARQVAERTMLRRYLAVVLGELDDEEGIIEAPLGRSPAERLRFAVVQSGRPARTRYRVLGHASSGPRATLVSCWLETGRTHQIRAHFAAIGHPVLADERYGGAGRAGRAVPLLGRPWLHAAELGFQHPVSGETMVFRSSPPRELALALQDLGLGEAAWEADTQEGTTMAT